MTNSISLPKPIQQQLDTIHLSKSSNQTNCRNTANHFSFNVNANQPQSNCISSCSSGLNHTASIFALLAAAIRFFDLTFVKLFTPAESASV